MTDWSIQYRSASGTAAATAANITPISGTVPAHGYFLVQEAVGGDTSQAALPAADATGTIGMAGTGFQVWLASTTVGQDPADGNIYAGTPNAAIIDLVGVGSTANSYEGATKAGGTANATSVAARPSPAPTRTSMGATSQPAPPLPRTPPRAPRSQWPPTW